MKASVFREPGVSDLSLCAAVSAVEAAGRNLPNIGGLQVGTDQIGYYPGLAQYPDVVDPHFIDTAPQWADGGVNLFITGRRLGLQALHGRGLHGRGLAIVSTYGLSDVENTAAAELEAVSGHELGHAFGLVEPSRTRYRAAQHCGNVCIMQPGSETDPNLLKRLTAIVSSNTLTGGYCGDCSADLRKISF